MDTLPDDLLILIAKHDLPAIQSIYPTARWIHMLIDKYMKEAFSRIMNKLTQFISPELLEIIVQHNLTISGSFILKCIANQSWYGDLDLVAKKDLPESIKTKLKLKNIYTHGHYSSINPIDHTSSNNEATFESPSITKIDLIVLKTDYNINDLLEDYDFDFVKNSLEFLSDGSQRLTIKNPDAVWNKKCLINIDNYGILDVKDEQSIQFRLARLMSRVKKYRSRGYIIKCDKQYLDYLILYLASNGERVAIDHIRYYISTTIPRLSDLHLLFDQ